MKNIKSVNYALWMVVTLFSISCGSAGGSNDDIIVIPEDGLTLDFNANFNDPTVKQNILKKIVGTYGGRDEEYTDSSMSDHYQTVVLDENKNFLLCAHYADSSSCQAYVPGSGIISCGQGAAADNFCIEGTYDFDLQKVTEDFKDPYLEMQLTFNIKGVISSDNNNQCVDLEDNESEEYTGWNHTKHIPLAQLNDKGQFAIKSFDGFEMGNFPRASGEHYVARISPQSSDSIGMHMYDDILFERMGVSINSEGIISSIGYCNKDDPDFNLYQDILHLDVKGVVGDQTDQYGRYYVEHLVEAPFNDLIQVDLEAFSSSFEIRQYGTDFLIGTKSEEFAERQINEEDGTISTQYFSRVYYDGGSLAIRVYGTPGFDYHLTVKSAAGIYKISEWHFTDF